MKDIKTSIITLLVTLTIFCSRKIEGNLIRSRVLIAPTGVYRKYNSKPLNTINIPPYLIPPSNSGFNGVYSQRDTFDGMSRDGNLWTPISKPFIPEPMKNRPAKELHFNKNHFEPILLNENKYISQINSDNVHLNQGSRIKDTNDSKNYKHSINLKQFVKESVKSGENSPRNISNVNTFYGAEKNAEKKPETDVEERVTKLLSDFEIKLNKILDSAVNKTSDKFDQITILDGNQIRGSTSLSVKRSAFGNFTDNNQPNRAFKLQEFTTVSNPTISGPKHAPLIGDNSAPYAETGYAGPPIQNLNSNRHSSGTLDYDQGERRKQRSQDANRKRGDPATTIHTSEQQSKDGKTVTKAQPKYINDPAIEPLTSNNNNHYTYKKLVNVDNHVGNTVNIGQKEIPTIYANTRLNVFEAKEKEKKNANLKIGSKYTLDNFSPKEKVFKTENIAGELSGYLGSKNGNIINMDDAFGSMSVKNKRIAQYFPNREGVKSYGDEQGVYHRGYNSLEHSPPDPYVALFLSHYGKYLPTSNHFGHHYRNLYSYLASNNIHNNKPFGSYKIYEDSDG